MQKARDCLLSDKQIDRLTSSLTLQIATAKNMGFISSHQQPSQQLKSIPVHSSSIQQLTYFEFPFQKPSKIIKLSEPGCYVRIYAPLFPPSTTKQLLEHYTGDSVTWDITQVKKFGVDYKQSRTHNFQVQSNNIPERLRGGAGYHYVYRPRGRNPRGPRNAVAQNAVAQNAAAQNAVVPSNSHSSYSASSSSSNSASSSSSRGCRPPIRVRGHRANILDPVGVAILQAIEDATGHHYNSIFASGI